MGIIAITLLYRQPYFFLNKNQICFFYVKVLWKKGIVIFLTVCTGWQKNVKTAWMGISFKKWHPESHSVVWYVEIFHAEVIR